jgi:hypothetical protein
MFTLQAPFPLLQTTTLLPDPQFSDQEGLSAAVTRKTAMDGTRYTYVKRKANRRKLKWSFRLTRNKGLELRAFIFAYFASSIKIIDHNSRIWTGNFTNNPFEFDTPERAAPAISPMPRGETQTIDLEFEGIEQ